jgi:RNA polymerase sigma-70 factor (ECF subfamily)
MGFNYQNSTAVNIHELQYQIATYEDHIAYKTLFFHLFPSLQNFAFSFVRSRMIAEEIASDSLLRVWVRRKMLLDIENLKLYLFVSVKNAALVKLKQEKKNSHFSLDHLQVEFISDYITPGESAELSELEKKIAFAVKELPPSCQLIYKLAKEDRLKYKEIAQLLDISIKTIDNQLAIAIKKISLALDLAPTQKK